MITLKPITGSTQIAAAGYDATQQVLAIQFHRGTHVYHYKGVPADVAEKFDAAESKGVAFGTLIRNKFEFDKVETSAV